AIARTRGHARRPSPGDGVWHPWRRGRERDRRRRPRMRRRVVSEFLGGSRPRAARMSDRTIVIAIDGPAASGKSSTAQWVARRLGFFHVDSGSLYRAATAVQLERQANAETWTDDAVLREVSRISFVPKDAAFVPLIDEQPSDDLLRGTEVTRHVSRVATMAAVRDWVNAQVRRAGQSRNVVVDGRDIGTVVFPAADLKVFLVADPWERARRRLIQRLGRHPVDEEIAAET